MLLAIDYGLPRREYYTAERRMGTMLCHYRHRFHDDPFTRIGLQDIGAWVDFSAAADAAQAAGLDGRRLHDPGSLPDRLRDRLVHERGFEP